MSSVKKSESLVRNLKERLKLRLPSTYSILDSNDVKGFRLQVNDGSWATTEYAFALRVLGIESQFTDVIGNQQKAYAPSKCQLIIEAGAVGVGLSALKIAELISEISRMGLRIDLYQNTTTNQPLASQFAADGSVSSSTLQGSIDPDLKWPLSGQ